MKPRLLYLTIVAFSFIFSSTLVLSQVHVEVKEAFNSGNSALLAKFFNKNVELFINQKEDVYSKAQAELILKDFFIKHQPDTFLIENQGFSDGINYIIAKLDTSNGNFRIYITYRQNAGKNYINRLNITDYK